MNMTLSVESSNV